MYILVSSDPPPPYTPPDPASRGRSSSSSGISETQSREHMGPTDALPRYSLNSDSSINPSGSRTSLENEGLHRSRSNSNRSDINITADSAIPHRSSSNTSLSNRGLPQSGVVTDSSQSSGRHSRTSSPTVNYLETNQPDTQASQTPRETIVHTNVVRVKHVTTEASTLGDGTSVKSCQEDVRRDEGMREPSEHTCNLSNHDNIQFADESNTYVEMVCCVLVYY